MSDYIEEPDTIRNELMDNGALSGGQIYDTEAEAIEAWNSRVKRYPESLAQRMLADGYEYELFELRNDYEHKLSKLRQQLEKERQIVEEIVRCRDCKHFSNWDGFNEFPSCVRHRIAVEPDGFCAWGERREE